MKRLSLPRWLTAGLCALGVAFGLFLLVQRWVQIGAILPWLLILACPLLHVFLHRGHRHDG